MVPGLQTWSQAWATAAYGVDGFWRRSRPRDHFATAAGPELAEALLALIAPVPELTALVDVGAGDGALLAALAAAGCPLDLVGVDLRPRPPGLGAGVHWVQDCWDVQAGGWTTGAVDALLGGLAGPALLVATEWLDDLPCRVAAAGSTGYCELRSDGTAGPRLPAADRAWVERWWPDGAQVDVGRTRDVAWAALVGSLCRVGGLALAVDYGHERSARPAAGSLAGFRAGRPVAARPDRHANLTAAVAVDALTVAGEQAGGRTLWRRRQDDVLAELLPAPEGGDPLGDLVARSRRAALLDPRRWGSHWWLLQEVGGQGRVTA